MSLLLATIVLLGLHADLKSEANLIMKKEILFNYY